MNISDVWLVNESDGIKVRVNVCGKWFTVIEETKTYNVDGSPSLISHFVSESGIRRSIKEAGGVGECTGDQSTRCRAKEVVMSDFWTV